MTGEIIRTPRTQSYLSIEQVEATERDERLDAGRGLTEERDTRVAERVKPDASLRTVQAAYRQFTAARRAAAGGGDGREGSTWRAQVPI